MQFLDFFLKGNLSLEAHPRKKPHDWVPEQGWQDLMKLTELASNKGQSGKHVAGAATCSVHANGSAGAACRVCLAGGSACLKLTGFGSTPFGPLPCR